MKRVLLLGVTLLFVAVSAFAQGNAPREKGEPQHSTIAVTLNGLNCNTPAGTGAFPALSWSFGATNTSTVGNGKGVGAGKATVAPLTIMKRADSCSPALFGAVLSGKHFSTLTLVQQDTAKDDVFTLTLSEVDVTAYQLGGDQSSEVPSEQLSFTFGRICVSDTQSGTKFCWDTTTNRAF
ncbi:MAG TPA: type VI secretion system tube protein Hcp [Terriglobales bacterium]|nr:type VI secretion system tube protein Hcp [Terriglobales bacterium]